MGFTSEIEQLMYSSVAKKVILKEKNGTVHNTDVITFNFGDDDERGISTLALYDGTWLYEDQIESIEILDE